MTRLTAYFALSFFLVTLVAAKAPLYGADNEDRIEGKFIVIYYENTTSEDVRAQAKSVALNAPVQYTYDFGSFKGIAVALDEAQLESLRRNPLVKEIHYDGIERIFDCVKHPNAPSWGLARTSHPGDIAGGLADDYHHDSDDATDTEVTVYVVDTGVYLQHNDFEGRATWGANYADSFTGDQNGHGTHCAGTVAGKIYGIAKKAKIVAVKVLGASGSGSTAGVIQGFQFVTREHQRLGGPSVASVSLGSTADGGKNAAVTASVQAGVVYSIAAGNSNADACRFYPASCPDAIGVGATAIGNLGSSEIDDRAGFSNYGQCVAIFAPGAAITSAWINGPGSSSILSGTSMACPHVSGAAALYLAKNPSATPVQVKAALVDQAQNDLIRNVGAASPNKLLFTTNCDDFAQ